MEKYQTRRVKIISTLIFLGILSSLLYHWYLVSIVGVNYYPYNTFLFKQDDRYNDYYNVYKASIHLNPYIYETSNYFPFAFTLMHLFTLLPKRISFLLFIGIFIIFFILYIYRNIPVKGKVYRIIAIVILGCLSYPVLFVLDRGNIEIWLFMSLVMFILLYIKQKYILSVIFLSIAISLKMYPVLFVLLFIIDKKYLLVIYTGICTTIITVFSAWLLMGGVKESFRNFKALMLMDSWVLKGGTTVLHHSASLYVPVKLMYYNFLTRLSIAPPHSQYENTINKYYLMIAMFVSTVVILFLLRYRMEFWKKVCLITMLFILLPQVSFDYKLLNLFIPMILRLTSQKLLAVMVMKGLG